MNEEILFDFGTGPARVKGKVYKVAVRPAMLYRLETVALTKRQEAIFIRSDKNGQDQE